MCCQIVQQKAYINFHSHQQGMWVAIFPYSCQHLVIANVLIAKERDFT